MSPRRGFLIAALVLMAMAVCIELGASFLPVPDPDPGALQGNMDALLSDDDPRPSVDELVAARQERPPSPGWAISALALVDGILLFLAVATFSGRMRGRVQIIATALVGLVALIASIIVLIMAFALLMTMLSLFLAVPFGTLAYLAIWGFFERGQAAGVLGLLLTFKLAYAVCLFIRDPRTLLRQRMLVVVIVSSLLCTALTSFLHGFVPLILVSITDMVAAIVIAVVGAIWGLVYLVRNVLALVTTAV